MVWQIMGFLCFGVLEFQSSGFVSGGHRQLDNLKKLEKTKSKVIAFKSQTKVQEGKRPKPPKIQDRSTNHNFYCASLSPLKSSEILCSCQL